MTKQSEKETMRRVDEALKRAFQMPHKPHEPLKKKGKGKRRRAREER
jgi:hypothetical protein